MKPIRTLRRAGLLAGVAALILPAAAFAHGSVFEVTAKVIPDPTKPSQLADETQYVVTNHGFTYVLKESNGALDHGMVNYKVLPSAYRKTLTKAQLLAEGDTGAQPHATCRNVAALDAEATILAGQGSDPFYNYIPFQTKPAGLEDDPAKWLPVIQKETGVDLTEVTDVASACTGLGGTYTPADATATSPQSLNSGLLEETTAPLQQEITQLTAARNAAQQALATAQATINQLLPLQGLTAQVADLKQELTALVVKPAAKRVGATAAVKSGVKATITGPQGRRVTVRLTINPLRAKALGLRSATLARTTVTIASKGSATATLKPKGKAATALGDLDTALATTIAATSGDRAASAKSTIGR